MTFRIYVAQAFWWPVKIAEPTDDGWKTQTLEVKYRRFDADGFDAFMARVRTEKLNDRQVAAEVVLDWRTVVNADGAEQSFSKDVLDSFCRTINGAAACLVRDFINCHTQGPEKN